MSCDHRHAIEVTAPGSDSHYVAGKWCPRCGAFQSYESAGWQLPRPPELFKFCHDSLAHAWPNGDAPTWDEARRPGRQPYCGAVAVTVRDVAGDDLVCIHCFAALRNKGLAR